MTVTESPKVAGQVRQLLAERANAIAYGMTTRVEACDKQLKTLGYRPGLEDEKTPAAPEDPAAPPQGRTATPSRRVSTDASTPTTGS